MSPQSVVVILVIFLVTFLIIFVISKKRKKSEMKDFEGQDSEMQEERKCQEKILSEPYIFPHDRKVGLIKGEKWRSANLCNDKVLYPIQQLEVDYGTKMPKNCPCTEFVQAP